MQVNREMVKISKVLLKKRLRHDYKQGYTRNVTKIHLEMSLFKIEEWQKFRYYRKGAIVRFPLGEFECGIRVRKIVLRWFCFQAGLLKTLMKPLKPFTDPATRAYFFYNPQRYRKRFISKHRKNGYIVGQIQQGEVQLCTSNNTWISTCCLFQRVRPVFPLKLNLTILYEPFSRKRIKCSE